MLKNKSKEIFYFFKEMQISNFYKNYFPFLFFAV